MNAKISLLFFGIAFGFAPQAAHAGQSFLLTPQSIDRWIVTGADRNKLGEAPSVILPAGAQLARNFNSGDIAINVDTSIVFGAEPADWPVLEIGPAALVFVRNGDDGTLRLILGDNDPISLPYVFKLDEGGRSVDAVHLTFASGGGVVAVNAQQKTRMFLWEGAMGGEPQVIVSAGGGSELPLANFEVVAGANEAASTDTLQNATNHNSSDVGKSDATAKSHPSLGFPASIVVGTAGTNDPTSKKPDSATAVPAKKIGLVVFSPSAFRLGRAALIRASASGAIASHK